MESQRIERIIALLDKHKAEAIELFRLEDCDYIAKYVIVASSLNAKHTQALYQHLTKAIKQIEKGMLQADVSDEWIVIDLGDMLIHLMTPEYRSRYAIEAFLSTLCDDRKRVS